MARGNQRVNAREKNEKQKKAQEVSSNPGFPIPANFHDPCLYGD